MKGGLTINQQFRLLTTLEKISFATLWKKEKMLVQAYEDVKLRLAEFKDRGKKMIKKGDQYFIVFLSLFSKCFLIRFIKSGHCVVKGQFLFTSSMREMFCYKFVESNELTLFQMTNCRLFQTERISQQKFKVSWKWRKVPKKG